MYQENDHGGRREYLWFAAALLLILIGAQLRATIPVPSAGTLIPSTTSSEH